MYIRSLESIVIDPKGDGKCRTIAPGKTIHVDDATAESLLLSYPDLVFRMPNPFEVETATAAPQRKRA
jgi:hypothetical protein